MKVLTYNILCGGDKRLTGENRRPRILSLLKDASPDIVALQEANGFDDPGILQAFSDSLGLPYFTLSNGALYEDGDRYNVVLFSRYQLSDIHHFNECTFQSAALSAVAHTPLGRLSLCTVHLHAFDERKRLAELSCLQTHQRKFPAQILLGDFNAVSRIDSYPAETSEFELTYNVTDKLNQSLVDLFAQNREKKLATFPTGLKAENNLLEPRRIDYIIASKNLSCLVSNLQVIRTPAARRASDHFPLLAEFGETVPS